MGFRSVLRDVDYKSIFEANPIGNLILDQNLIIVAVTDTYLKMTLTTRDYLLGKHIFEAFPDNPNDPNASGVSQLRASLERVLKDKLLDTMAIQKYDIKNFESGDFEERFWSPINTPVLDDNGEVKYIIHRVEDVTPFVILKSNNLVLNKKNQSELDPQSDQLERIRQAQRMEAMGQLAGGVAHDFNNILAVILINCDLFMVKNKDLKDERKIKIIQQIQSSAERAANLTRQLLSFSRKQVLQPKLLLINEIIPEVAIMLDRLLTENIHLELKLDEKLKHTCIDQGQVEQIVMNLVVNARDAMPIGGKITIETSNVYLDTAMANGNIRVEPGDYVMLAVRDTGHGMDAETQARIFEPFFTTKSIGKGTGLGLATVYGIVTQQKGTIWVYSELGKGTVFKIYLPVASQEERSQDNNDLDMSKRKNVTGHEKVLVVEDQQDLRELVSNALVEFGYEVTCASNGREAFNICENKPGFFDIIITDVIMPEMSGHIFAQKLLKLNPVMKFLFLSGYTEGELDQHGFNDQSFHFIEKPFSLDKILDKVHEILQQPN